MMDNPKIVLTYENTSPLDLLDLTGSLAAFGETFRRYAVGAGMADRVSEAKLQVASIRRGSIVAELVPFMEQLDWVIENRDVAAGFLGNWGEFLEALRNGKIKREEADLTKVRAANSFMEPVAKDSGSQVNMAVSEGAVVHNTFIFNQVEASAIQRNADRLLGPEIPAEMMFTEEPMILHQVRDAKSGDMGIIDRFGPRPAKLFWAGEEVKRDVLEAPENPFGQIFFVTGKVKTAGGLPASYTIYKLDGTAPREL